MSDLTAADVAAEFDCGREFVMDQCRKGRWPYYRIGRKYWFRPEHVEAIKALSERKPTAQVDEGWGVKKRGAS